MEILSDMIQCFVIVVLVLIVFAHENLIEVINTIGKQFRKKEESDD